MKRSPRQGFTLIELSIVLVIIGLIIGGVLVGRDLIEAATIRAQISQIDNYRKAVQTFKLKYNCLPGDCANPDALGLYDAATGLGAEGIPDYLVNDGKVTQYIWSTQWYTLNIELISFWYHLFRAGLIADYTPPNPYVTPDYSPFTPALFFSIMPASKLNKKIIVIATQLDGRGAGGVEASGYDAKGGNGFVLASPTDSLMGTGQQADFVSDNSVPVQTAKAIDTKIDDGAPFSGSVVAGAAYLSIDACTIACYVPDCAPYTQNTYNLPVADGTLGRCNVAFLRQF